MEVLGALMDAFTLILQPDLLMYVFFGVLMGIALGILPGLGGIAGMSILIVVLTQFQNSDPLAGIAIAIGMIAVIPTSDTFASVLLGIPGSSASQATVLDGFPLAKQGKAAQALSSAFVSSLFGGILGVVVLTVILGFAASVVTYIRTPAQFMLAIFGIALVGILSGRSLLKGFLAAGLGLFVGMMGMGALTNDVRFIGAEFEWLRSFSDWTAQYFPHKVTARNPNGFIEEWQRYLGSGLGVAMIGLSMFAVPEIVDLLRQNKAIAGDAKLGLGWRQGFLDWWRNKTLSLWNAFVGVIVGIVPGLGGSVVDWIAYGQTKAIVAARGGDMSQFGKGDIRGVIGPESANNAKEGGGLVPTLLLGLPGSGSMAVFLGVLSLFSIEAGPPMFNTTVPLGELNNHGHGVLITGMVVTFFIAWTLMIGNVMGTALCFGLSAPISRLTKIPFPVLAPFLLIIIYLAVFKISRSASFYSLLTLLTLGGLGVLLRRFKWSRPAFLIGFVLAGPLETKFNWASQRIARGNMETIDWILMLVIGLLTVLAIVYGVIVNRQETKQLKEAGHNFTRTMREKLPMIVFTGFVVLIFTYMAFGPLNWGRGLDKIYAFGANTNDSQMPHFLGLVFLPLALFAFFRVLFNRGEQELLEDEECDAKAHGVDTERRSLLTGFGWIAGYVLAIALVGHLLGTLLFASALLFSYSPLRWWWNALLVTASVILLIFFVDLLEPRLVLGGVKRLFGDVEMLDPILDYLRKPVIFEPLLEWFENRGSE